MATVEQEENAEATILPFPGPLNRQELIRNDELRRRIKATGFVFIRYRSGPRHVGHVVVPKAEVLRRLDEYPD